MNAFNSIVAKKPRENAGSHIGTVRVIISNIMAEARIWIASAIFSCIKYRMDDELDNNE